ncbi:MAG TPA: SpoIVB peptidase S55 domain-containing protein [Thermoanaerobaculia bacterium]|nr:SpoIVB peptidase S55 domain-containing protein [Thermoanaerobaculia bacterium]
MRKILAFLAFVSLAAGSLSAAEIMPLSDVHKGMKGYGVTVFEGDRLEKFDVEILGVLNKVGPQQDLILARVDHAVLRSAGVIAGMSGSPIYIDGKIVGALAYAWDFAKDPIAGITPIEQMLTIGKRAEGAVTPPNRGSGAAFLNQLIQRDPRALSASLESLISAPRGVMATGATQIATPVSFSGFGADTIARFGKALDASGLMAVPSGTSGSGSNGQKVVDGTFREGDAIAAVLVSGDLSVAATGTVTYVNGKNVYAFGHPFLDMGQISFPMAKADIVTVLPNLARSFKFSNSGAIIGAVQQDRASGIMGVLGAKAETIPVDVTVDDAHAPQLSHFEIVRQPQMFPLLLSMVADSIVARSERAAGERTVLLDSEIDVRGMKPIRLRDAWAGAEARQSIPAYLGLVSSYLLSNEFSDARIDRVKITLRHDDGVKTAKLLEASADTPEDGEFNPGDIVHVRTTLKPYRGEAFQESFDVRIPQTMKQGKAYLFIGSGSMMNRLDFSLIPPDPRSLSQVIGVIERLRSSNDLTVGLYSSSEGAVTAGVYRPDLPPSVHAIVNNDSSNSAQASVRFHAPDHQSRPLDFVVDGAVKIDVDVKSKL